MSFKSSIAFHIESLHEQIMPVSAEDAAQWIIDQIEVTPEMIEVGMKELREHYGDMIHGGFDCQETVQAMLEAAFAILRR